MSTCEQCKKENKPNVSTHELIEIEMPGLNEPVRLSLGFWKSRGNGEHALCALCKAGVLLEAVHVLMEPYQG